MAPNLRGVGEGSEDFEGCCEFVCCVDGGAFVVSEFFLEMIVCSFGCVLQGFSCVKAVACFDCYLGVVPESSEDFLICWCARDPWGEFEVGLFVDVSSVVEGEGEGSMCTEVSLVIIVIVVGWVVFSVDVVEDGVFGVCDVCVWCV